jgi:hypothetical protein
MSLKNPFAVYIVGFGLALLLYQLGWSELYPPLSPDLIAFFLWSFLAAGILALLVQPAVAETSAYLPGLLPWWSWIPVAVTFGYEIWQSGGIPIVMVARGVNFFVLERDANHLHGFTLWSVFAAVRFADFLYGRRLRHLIEAMMVIVFYGLMVYRGPAIMTVVSFGFLILIRFGRIRARYWALGAAAFVAILLVNGLMGDLRSPNQEEAGAPSPAFRTSGMPRTFFWGYLYATAPIANFEEAVARTPGQQGNALEFIATELLPDTFSRRILPLLNPAIESGTGNLVSRDQLYSWSAPLITVGLNTASIFGRSYGYFGWLGPVIMFVALSAFCILYLILIRDSPYRVVALALLNTLVLLCLINNMLASAAMIPQLVWPLLLPPWRILPAQAETFLSNKTVIPECG